MGAGEEACPLRPLPALDPGSAAPVGPHTSLLVAWLSQKFHPKHFCQGGLSQQLLCSFVHVVVPVGHLLCATPCAGAEHHGHGTHCHGASLPAGRKDN